MMLNRARTKAAHITTGLLPLTLLVVLLLFSSCKLRASVQVHLGIPVATTLNASKATVGTLASCVPAVEATQTSLSKKKPNLLPFSTGFRQSEVRLVPALASHGITRYFSRGSPSENTPLYILYRKMKLPC